MQTPTPASSQKISVFTDSSSLLGNAVALRKRADEDGYLFFKQLLPKEDIFPVRQDLLSIVDSYGWRTQGQSDLGGEIDGEAINRVPAEQMRLDIGVSTQAYDDVQRLESVHRLPHHKNLIALYQNLFGSEVLVHPRHIIRMITPHKDMSPTPPHQDFPLIQGTAQTWTCWFPLGECPPEMGGLAVLRGSHRLGYLPIQPSAGAGGIAVQLCPSERSGWVSGYYELGDVLTFSSLTVHRALRCQLKNQIRLSMDVRYQAAGEVIEERSLKPHCELGWDDIYSSWTQDDLKYYWQRTSQSLSPWDDTLWRPRQRIC